MKTKSHLAIAMILSASVMACGASPSDAGASLHTKVRKPATPEPVVKKKVPVRETLTKAEIAAAVRSAGDLRSASVPVFKDTVKAKERKELVARLDQALADMKLEDKALPPKIQDGVKVWESLEPLQREQMLTGTFGDSAAVPTWAVAAVGAAALVYEVGKDYNWWGSAREKFTPQTMSTADLDYIEATLGITSTPALSRSQIVAALRSAGDLKAAKVPVFPDAAKPDERKTLVARLDQAIIDMKRDNPALPPKIQDGVKVWESLDPLQREQMLGGKFGQVAAVPTWAVAAVGAAALVYEVGKDYNWWGSAREKFMQEGMQAADLDYAENYLKAPPLSRVEIKSTLKQIGDLKSATLPVFKDSVKAKERKTLVARLDQAIMDMKRDNPALPPKIQEGVKVWESLEPLQREQMLGGKFGQVAAIPTWAVAAVGAAALVYDVGKDYNWWGSAREKFGAQVMKPVDLDYVESFGK